MSLACKWVVGEMVVQSCKGWNFSQFTLNIKQNFQNHWGIRYFVVSSATSLCHPLSLVFLNSCRWIANSCGFPWPRNYGFSDGTEPHKIWVWIFNIWWCSFILVWMVRKKSLLRFYVNYLEFYRCDVTVWNRTKSKCDPLISLGAT